MTAIESRKTITNLDQLRDIIAAPPPDSGALRKELQSIDKHARDFIAKSPFALLSTSGASGRCDVSPRGDGPGFVHVLDDMTVVIPDRPGNARLDSLQNIIENPHAGLLFLVPGVDETLRLNGRATLVQDPELLERMAMKGKAPKLGIVVEVEELFFHCARSFKRASLWDHETWIERSELPTLGKIIADQLKLGDEAVEAVDAGLEKANKALY